ncbi:ATP-grasp domain-containing protein [Paraoerskovia marina]|uniref:ATP-grasp domain-containing protein n=1 Tax=Paraoerskovia marina TaxID=545619 RepID=UPI000492A5B7|nr:hypothetical protein [Paraoerskovia marina]
MTDDQNTTSRPRVALATCAVLPNLDADDAPLIPALEARGIDAVAVVWDDPSVDWSAFDAVVVRSVYDYSARRDEFVSWAASVGTIINPEPILRWNTDKYYLRELESAGLSIIPTLWLDPARKLSAQAIHTRMPAQGDFVIKPVVSAGAQDTGRYLAGEAPSRGLAIAHVKRLLADGRHVMVQPYVKSVDTAGEARLVFFEGEFAYAVTTSTRLTGPHQPTRGLYRREIVRSHEPTQAQLDVARRALDVVTDAVSDAGMPLYARVDLVWGEDGDPMIIEVELTEPSLFMSTFDGAVNRFADAIAAQV